MASPEQSDKKIKIIGWIIIVLIPLTVFAVASELMLRLVFPKIKLLSEIVMQLPDSQSYVLKPNTQTYNAGWNTRIENPIFWQINPQGLRSEHPTQKNSNKFRILTYGDSETFGWSVNIEDTWQLKMQAIDDRIEVLNFGIFGYNVENVADHIARTLPEYDADLMIYLMHKNDYYPPFVISPILSKSYLYLVYKMALYEMAHKKRKAWRRSPEGKQFFAAQIERIIDLARNRDIPIIIAVLHWKYRNGQPPELQIDYSEPSHPGKPYPPGFHAITVNIEKIVKQFPRYDRHMTEPAHIELAAFFCRVIARGGSNSCMPPSGQ